MKNVLLFIWQLPQNIIGFILFLIIRNKEKILSIDDGTNVYKCFKKYGGISLGNFIFVHKLAGIKTVSHEVGHHEQSKRLGWLYLLVIGIPSFLWASLYTIFKFKVGYYWFYTESWANKLGEVE